MDSRLLRLLPALLGIWLAWAAYDLSSDGGRLPPVVAPPRPPRIAPAHFPLRAAEEPAPAPARDPFDRPLAAAPAEAAAPAQEEVVMPEPEAMPAPLPEFVLEALLVHEGGGGARICGQDVRVGEAIAGIDAEQPPVLVRVERGAAYVLHRGIEVRIELGSRGRSP